MNNSYLSLLFLLLLSCSPENRNEHLKESLKRAGSNRAELEKVIQKYAEKPEDSLKLKATCFLIKNMPYHFSRDEYYASPDGKEYRPDAGLYNTIGKMKQHCESLAHKGYSIEKQKVYDITTLDSSFLVNNIELAFEAWGKGWAKNVPFDDFCRFILPYRDQSEMTSASRKEMMDKFLPLLEMVKPQTPLEACLIIHQELIRTMKYKETGIELYPAIEETYCSGGGLCEDLSMMTIFIMRAVGIPVAMEQTTWVKGDRGHVWATVLSDGRFHGFNPCSDQPNRHLYQYTQRRMRIPAKVYRSHYEPIKPIFSEDDDGYVTYLKNPFIEDVTAEYPNKTINLQVTADKKSEKSQSQIYLCAYNSGYWKEFAMGYRKKDNCVIEHIVGDNVFIIADSPDGSNLRFITVPFYVSPAGDIRKIVLDTAHKKKYTLNKIEGQWNVPHTLQYWDTQNEQFSTLQQEAETDSTLLYTSIPDNALMRFTIPIKKYDIRIFLIQKDSIMTY